MSRSKLRILIAAAALCAGAHGASAEFSSLKRIGDTRVQPDPSCVVRALGKVLCAAMGAGGEMVANLYDGSRWGGWKVANGDLASAPSCAPIGDGRVLCAGRGGDGRLNTRRYEAGAWSDWVSVDFEIRGAPSCATYAEGRALCTILGTDGRIVSFMTNGLEADPPLRFGPLKVTVGPRCVNRNPNAILDKQSICTYGTANGLLWTFAPEPRTQSKIGDRMTSEAACVGLSPASSNGLCLFRDVDSSLRTRTGFGSTWSAPSIVDGAFAPGMSCASNGTTTFSCGVLKLEDSALYAATGSLAAGTVGALQRVGGVNVGAPSCFKLEAGKIMCVVVGADGIARSTVGP